MEGEREGEVECGGGGAARGSCGVRLLLLLTSPVTASGCMT